MDRLFMHAFEHTPIGVGLVSLEGNWMKVNPALCQILGYTENQFLQLTVEDITHPDDMEWDRQHAHALIKNEIKSCEIEKRLYHQLGHPVWIQLNVSLVRDEEGQPLFFVSQIQDITERKKLKEDLMASEAKYRLMAENTTDLIGILDSDMNVIYASPSHKKMLGFNTFEGENGRNFYHPDDLRRVEREIVELKKFKSTRRFELRLVNIHNQIIDVETEITPVLDENGELETIVYVTRNISEKKRADEVIIQSERLYRSLYEGLNFISKVTQRVMRKEDLLNILVQIVGNIFETEKVGTVCINRAGKPELTDDIKSIPIPKENLYTAEKALIRNEGFIFTRVATCGEHKYFVFVENRKQRSCNKPLFQWLLTISRFSEILCENINKIEDILTELKYLVKEKQGPAWLSRLLFKVQEQQRLKLSIDLHDSALQEQIIWYRKLTEFIDQVELPQPMLERLKRIHEGFEEVMYQIRITCNELTPQFLNKLGIIKALEFLFQQTHIRSGNYVIEFNHKGNFQELNDDQVLGVYRIVQELLSNATKHSRADRVKIGLFNENGSLSLLYEDNGIGIEEKVFYGTSRQIGLYGIQERVRSLEGEIMLNSTHSGSKIKVKIPLKAEWDDELYLD